jgi:hypothetical protein
MRSQPSTLPETRSFPPDIGSLLVFSASESACTSRIEEGGLEGVLGTGFAIEFKAWQAPAALVEDGGAIR